MPWIDDKIEPLPVQPTGTALPNPIKPQGLDVVAAAFRQENPLVSVARLLWDGFYTPEPGHNPLDHIAGTMFEERYADRFIGSQSGPETFAIMQRIQEEERDRETLDAAGFGGTVASIAAGTLDPTLALPGGVLVRGVRGGYALTKSAANVGLSAALAAGVSETALQLSHETRTLGESTANIASAAILGGLIGGGAAALLSRAEANSLARSLDRERAATAFHNGATSEAFNHLASAGDVVAHGRATPDEQGFIVFHGSPHDFDRFSMEHIGTGEGAQAFGHGLYFAESEGVARSYQATLGEGAAQLRFKGLSEEQQGALPQVVRSVAEDFEPTPANIREHLRIAREIATRRLEGNPSMRMREDWQRWVEQIDDLLARPDLAADVNKGQLYRARIRADQSKFLDWDRPISEQSSAVKEIAARVGIDPSATGQELYRQLAISKNNPAAGAARMDTYASQSLREAGVPGIKYLDQGSRDAGDGTRNFVVVDDSLLEIVDKNGIPLARPTLQEPVPSASAQGPTGTGLGASVGAAASDTRTLELERSGLGGTARISPTRFVLSAESPSARRTVADLAETPYRFQNDEGPNGPALDRLARNEINGARVEVSDGLDRLFSEYRFGDPEKTMPRLKARFEDFVGRAPDKMTFAEFKSEVARALIEGDTHAIPQVEQAAQLIRRRVFDPWKERAIAAGLLPEGVEVKTAQSYFQRVYNKERIRAERPAFVNKVQDWLKSDQITKAAAKERITALNDELQGFEAAIAKANNEESAAALMARRDEVRAKIEEEIAAWEGKSVSEAKSAIKAREKYDADRKAKAVAEGAEEPTDRLRQADAAIDRNVKSIIESNRELSDAELRDRAHEITKRILGSPDGRLPYDIPMGGPEIGWKGAGGEPARGPLAGREFNIPDAVIRDFLEDDVETVVAMHLRTIVPDVLLTERFGDVRMTEAFKKINEDYARLTDAATSEKERVRLAKEEDSVIERLAGIRDRVRGVYGWREDMRNMARVAAGAKVLNNLTSMGVSAISSLPDMAGAVLRYGLSTTFRDGWTPYFKYLTGNNEGWDKFKSQMRAVGIGIETATNARQNALDDVTDVYRPGSRFERGLQAVNDRFFIANLLAPLTDIQKTIAAHVAVSEILRTAKAASEGKATKKQIGNLAESGIDQQMAGRIWQQFQTGGEVVDGVHLPNTREWTDRQAADALSGAVGREVDIAVVTPGQEKPLWMSAPVMSVLGQFKSFTAAATERVLVANLMRRDAHTLNGVMASMALGMLSYKLNAFFGGQDTSKRPQDWVKEGVSRGGLLGWFEEGNALASKMTRGGVDVYRMIGADKPLSRFASRSTLDMLLGPTAAKIEGLSKVTGSAAAGDWTAADTTALRRLVAAQNLFYLRGAINQAEGGFNQMLGVPPRAEPENRR